jgi:hypothetical protein
LGRTAAIGAAAAAVLALTVTVMLLARGPGSPAPAPAASIRLFQPAPPDTSIVSGGVLSPDSRRLAFVARDEASGQTALWVRTLDSTALERLDGTAGASKPFWSPDSRRIAYFAQGKLLTYDLDDDSTRIITTVFAEAGGTWGPDDTILFAEWASGLYSIRASGDGEVATIATLDRNAEDIAYAWPQFFSDGRRFLFQIVSLDADRTGIYIGDLESDRTVKLLDTTSVATLAPPHYVLHVQNDMLIAEQLDTEQHELTGHAIVVARGVSEPTLAAENVISASAELLAFQHGLTTQNLAWSGPNGEPLGALALPTVLFNPRMSPDGSRLVATSSLTADPGLWLVELERDEYTRLEQDAIAPVWSPGGERVAFTARGGHDLILRTVDSFAKRRILASDDSVKILNDWSPDGSQIVFSRHGEATGLDLWLIDPDSGAQRQLLVSSHTETQARISPDGQWIAYASDESGRLETYVARFPGLEDTRRLSVDGGGQPQWRTDQNELYYLSPDRSVMAVSTTGGDPRDFGAPRRLFHTSIAGDPGDARDYFAAAGDGSRFLIDSASNDSGIQAITIVVNWSAGLADRTLDAEQAAAPRH